MMFASELKPNTAAHYPRIYADGRCGSVRRRTEGRNLALLSLCAALTGCTGGPMVKTSPAATHIRWVVAPVEVIRAFRGCESLFIFACAVRFSSGHCVILSDLPEEQTSKFIRDEEYKHCEGWDHVERFHGEPLRGGVA